MQNPNLKPLLSSLYNAEGSERIGFIVNNQVIEVKNWADKAQDGWLISGEDTMKYAEIASGTWHTHPGHPSNLGGDDFLTFMEWPEMVHYIIGNDGVRCFQYDEKKKAVMELHA